jgi:hypothetical protein
MLESPLNTPEPAARDDAALTLEYLNDAVIALDVLYEAALESTGAREELRAEADRLIERAGNWRDANHVFKGRGE